MSDEDGTKNLMRKRAKTLETEANREETSEERSNCRCKSPIGLVCALFSGLFGAASGLMIKYVNEADADQIQFVRACLQYFSLVPLITYRRENVISDKCSTNIFLLSRGAVGLVSHVCLIYSIRYLPLGDAISIQYVYVTLVGLFAFLCLKEPCGIFNIVVTFTTLGGLIFISQPSFLFGAIDDGVDSADRTVGVILALSSAVLIALAYILVRKMGAKVHYSLSLFYYAWEGLIFLPVFMACRKTLRVPCSNDILYMSISGIFGFLAQILMTIALQKEQAGPVTVVQTFQIIFAFLFQVIFLGSPISLYSGIGAALIFVSSAALVLRNMRKDRDDHDE